MTEQELAALMVREVRTFIEERIAALATKDDLHLQASNFAELIEREASAARERFAALPIPKDGKDADMEALEQRLGELVDVAVKAIPVPKDGTSVTVADVAPIIERAIQRAADGLPRPEPGAQGRGIAEASLSRAGHLLLRFTDGETADLGPVVAESPDPLKIAEAVRGMIPTPRDGQDGIATRDELRAEVRQALAELLPSAVEGAVLEAIKSVPRIAYQGVWKAGTFVKGDAVTFGGSLFICRADETTDKPETSAAWQLAVKRGRDLR